MVSKEICRGALVVGALLATQTAIFNPAKADAPAATGASDWTGDPTLQTQLQPEQKFGKFSLQLPEGYTVQSISRDVSNGTETLYKYKGPIRLDKTYPLFIVYVLTPSGDSPAWTSELDNPLPATAEGVQFFDQSKGSINGIPANFQEYIYRVTGQKHERKGFEFTATDGSSTIAISGLDFSQHFDDTAPLLRTAALTAHE